MSKLGRYGKHLRFRRGVPTFSAVKLREPPCLVPRLNPFIVDHGLVFDRMRRQCPRSIKHHRHGTPPAPRRPVELPREVLPGVTTVAGFHTNVRGGRQPPLDYTRQISGENVGMQPTDFCCRPGRQRLHLNVHRLHGHVHHRQLCARGAACLPGDFRGAIGELELTTK